jgi:hypothetical protein
MIPSNSAARCDSLPVAAAVLPFYFFIWVEHPYMYYVLMLLDAAWLGDRHSNRVPATVAWLWKICFHRLSSPSVPQHLRLAASAASTPPPSVGLRRHPQQAPTEAAANGLRRRATVGARALRSSHRAQGNPIGSPRPSHTQAHTHTHTHTHVSSYVPCLPLCPCAH